MSCHCPLQVCLTIQHFYEYEVYIYIFTYLRCWMSKNLKKEVMKLKFDTSSANLDCFIRKKSKQKSSEIDLPQKRSKKTRKKSKVIIGKNEDFQANKFLENIIANAINEEFVNPKEIKELIENMKFSSGEMDESSQQKEGNYKIEDSEPLQTEIFSIIELRSKSSNYKSIIESCQKDSKQPYNLSTKLYTEQKPEHPTIQTCSITPDSRMSRQQSPQALDFKGSMTEEIHYPLSPPQSQPYYPNGMYYQNRLRGPPRRGDDASDYKIFLDRVDNFSFRLKQMAGQTIMIRHIPNKYSQEMLLEELNRNHRVKFNFLYLPIDYYNSCNVGYAFVNFIHTKFISQFYKEFNGKKWNKFNSEKICELAYARIQGTTSLMDHFQNGHVIGRGEKKKSAVELGEGAIKGIQKIIQGQKFEEDA